MLVDQENHALPIGPILTRGFAAAHGTLLGALYLFLLHAPAQVLSAVALSLQGTAIAGAGQPPDATQLLLYVSASLGGFVFALAVFFLFPLVLGGILGQVRDRLAAPQQPPGPFGAYGGRFYVRLLGSQGLFVLALLVLMLPVMCFGMVLAFQEMAKAMPEVTAEGAATPPPPDFQQMNRRLLSHPVVLGGMVFFSFLASAVSMVYWVANSIVVSEEEGVLASWRRALRFCGQNFAAVLVVWLLTFAVGVLISPLSLVGQLGLVTEPWTLVGVALVYSALIGYWGGLLSGLNMSLYLARRQPSAQPEPELAVPA